MSRHSIESWERCQRQTGRSGPRRGKCKWKEQGRQLKGRWLWQTGWLTPGGCLGNVALLRFRVARVLIPCGAAKHLPNWPLRTEIGSSWTTKCAHSVCCTENTVSVMVRGTDRKHECTEPEYKGQIKWLYNVMKVRSVKQQ